jgi:hypothetical protein
VSRSAIARSPHPATEDKVRSGAPALAPRRRVVYSILEINTP